IGKVYHFVVKPRDGYTPVFIMERRNHLTEHIDRIGYRSAVNARVQVAVGSGNFHFHVAQAAQASRNGRMLQRYNGSVGYKNDIRLETFLVFSYESAEVVGAHFFLSLYHELDVAWELVMFDHRLKCLHMHVGLAFVVRRATGIYLVILDDRLKGRGVPFFYRIGRLHVVVSVHQHGGKRWIFYFFTIDNGVSFRLADFHLVGAGVDKFAFQKFRGLAYILAMATISAY